MALTIGELVGYIRADGSNFDRSLAQSQLRMEGFRVGVDGRLRDLAGRFVDESEVMGRALSDSFSEAERAGTRIVTVYSSVADAQSRTLRQRFQRIAEEGRQLGDRLGDAFGRAREAFDRLNFDRLRGAAGALGNVAMAVGRMGATVGAAVPVVAGLAAAAGQVAPAAGVAVTGLIAMRLAAVALKLGMVGVQDAVTAALDPEKAAEFEEAIKKLAPEAQKFARQVKALAPEFKALQQEVQNRLFKGFDGALKGLAKDTLPVLKTGLMDAADSLNAMGKGVAFSAQSLARNGTLGKALAGANAGLRNLSRAPGQFVTALTQVGAAAAPVFGRLTASAGKTFDKLSQRLTKAFQSGAMEKAIEQAIALIKDLMEVAGNVGSILASVFKAAQVSGGGMIGVLKEITGALADAFASPEIQGGLRALFETMAQLAKSAAPILVSVLKTVAGVFEQLGPPIQQLIQHLGAGLLKIVEALGPVLVVAAKAVGDLVVAALPLIDVAAELVSALLPALVPLFEALSKIIQAAAPFIAQLAQAAAALLMPILNALANDVLPRLLPPFVKLAEELFPMLTEVLVALAPMLADLGVALAEILIAAAPLITEVLQLAVVLLRELMPAIKVVTVGLAYLVSGGLTLVSGALTRYVIPSLKLMAALMRGDWSAAVEHGKTVSSNFSRDVGRHFRDLKAFVMPTLRTMGQDVARRCNEMGNAIFRGFNGGIIRLVQYLGGIAGRIKNAFGNPNSMLFGIGRSIIRGLIDGIESMLGGLANTLGGVTARIPDWKGPAETDAKLLVPAGQLVMQGFQRGIRSQIPALRAQLQGITGDMPQMALAGASGGYQPGGRGGAATVRVVVDGPEAMKALIRTIVIEDGGGDVTRAFNT
jgi:phage-related protein